MNIKFGTSGWRAIIAEDFTFSNVRLVAKAISDYVKENEPGKKVLVGYDTRFFADKFAQEVAKVLAEDNIYVDITEVPTPTPVLSFEVIDKKYAGAVNLTASHNPAEYCGIKFSPSYGGPALPETTNRIEELILKYQNNYNFSLKSFEYYKNQGLINTIYPYADYYKKICSIIDFDLIKKSGLKIAVDCMYGTAVNYLDKILNDNGIEYKVFNNYRDPLFGGHYPEPDEENLEEMIHFLIENKYDIGLGTDGDADRFGIVDSDGSFIKPNEVISILFLHLLKTRNIQGSVVKTLATTNLIEAIAKHHDIKIHDTPVGFKYIGEIMNNENVIIGGEESGGLSIGGHVPEKDGILACLLMLEVMAKHKKPFKAILEDIYNEYGRFINMRDNIKVTDEKKNSLKKLLNEDLPEKILDKKVIKVDKRDGVKMILEDGSWLLVRFSGTEPLVRFYVESNSKERSEELLNYLKNLV